MTIPDYQSIMLPMLKATGDEKEHRLLDLISHLSDVFDLEINEVNELLPSGKQRKLENRVGWARTYLKKAGLLETTGVGRVKITARGLEALKKNPPQIDRKFLMQFPEFVEFQKVQKKGEPERRPELAFTGDEDELTPTELIDASYRHLRKALAEEILDRIKNCSPKFFENLVLDLLVAMGYGGSRRDAERVGRSGDGGIDGTINEDKLGLDVLYVQAKRWDKGIVGLDPVQRFAGSLDGKRAKKGIFITTSQFVPAAREYVRGTEKKIVLIDGQELAEYMIDHGIGVAEVANYAVKKIDADYFGDG